MGSQINGSEFPGLRLRQPTSGPSSPSISDSGNTLVESEAQRTPSVTSSCQINPTICNKPIDWENEKDPANDLEVPCHGWPELTKVICEHPSFEAFQSFKDLHIKSLLYYQAELAQIRKELHLQEWVDHRLNPFKDAYTLSSRADTLLLCDGKADIQKAQIDLVRRMRTLLKEYSDALLQYSKINELPPADHFNVNTLHNILRKPPQRHIGGPGSDSWGKLEESIPPSKSPGRQFIHLLRSLTIFWAEEPETNLHDLVVPGKSRDVDGFTRWVTNEWIPFWHSIRRHFTITAPESAVEVDPEVQHTDKEDEPRRPSNSSSTLTLVQIISRPFIRRRSSSGSSSDDTPENTKKARSKLFTYKIERIRTFTSFVATIVACLLPTAAIAILATIHSTAEVLGFIGLFTALFATGLMGLADTATSRTEIFTATAAFSAVLVVFVQNQNDAPGGSNGS